MSALRVDELAHRCRWELHGYEVPGGDVHDIEERLSESERNTRSWARSVGNLSSKVAELQREIAEVRVELAAANAKLAELMPKPKPDGPIHMRGQLDVYGNEIEEDA